MPTYIMLLSVIFLLLYAETWSEVIRIIRIYKKSQPKKLHPLDMSIIFSVIAMPFIAFFILMI